MFRVQVGLDFKGKSGEGFFVGLHLPGVGLAGTGGRGNLYKGVQHFPDTEIVDGGTEEDRGLGAVEVEIQVKGLGRHFDEFHIFPELAGLGFGNQFVQLGIFQILDQNAVAVGGGVARREDAQFLFFQVVDALEPLAHADGPGQGHTFDLELIFDVGEDVQGLHALPVQLVDEGDDGGVAHAAHLHELLGLGFNALGRVNDHHRAVHGGEHPVGIFGKVLMARGVQQVDLVVLVVELHHR